MRERQNEALHASPYAGEPGRPFVFRKRVFVVAALAGLLLSFTGAFGTAQLPLASRILYWLLLMQTGAFIMVGASAAVRGSRRYSGSLPVEIAVTSLVVAVPLTIVVVAATSFFYGKSIGDLPSFSHFFLKVVVISLAMTAIIRSTDPPSHADPHAAPAAGPTSHGGVAEPRFMKRLPAHLRQAEVHALEAEDHYLRVHTSAGSCLILMRMADAVGELEGLEGARTHRSWWVARAAVRSARRMDGRAELTLISGIEVPVSRSCLPRLRQEGWIG